MLLSVTDDEVLAAAEELSDELQAARRESNRPEFNALLLQCNDAITEEIGVDYSSACDAGDCC